MLGKQVNRNEDRRCAAARETRREETAPRREPADDGPSAGSNGRGDPGYSEEHAQVFTALALTQEEHNGDAVYLDDIADGAGLPEPETRALLDDLISVHHVAAELEGSDTSDLGPRFEVKPSR